MQEQMIIPKIACAEKASMQMEVCKNCMDYSYSYNKTLLYFRILLYYNCYYWCFMGSIYGRRINKAMDEQKALQE